MIAKDKMMNNFDDRVKLEAQINDCTQVWNYTKINNLDPLKYVLPKVISVVKI